MQFNNKRNITRSITSIIHRHIDTSTHRLSTPNWTYSTRVRYLTGLPQQVCCDKQSTESTRTSRMTADETSRSTAEVIDNHRLRENYCRKLSGSPQQVCCDKHSTESTRTSRMTTEERHGRPPRWLTIIVSEKTIVENFQDRHGWLPRWLTVNSCFTKVLRERHRVCALVTKKR